MPAIASKTNKKIKFITILGLTTLFLTACGGEKPAAPTKPTTTNTSQAPTPKPEQATETTAATPQTDETSAKPADTATDTTNNNSATVTPAIATTDPKILAIGKTRYDQTCHLCHVQGMLNAPKPDDKIAWKPRLAKGMDTLQQNAIKGFGKMPAQAVDGISEEEVKAAVEYMVSKVQ